MPVRTTTNAEPMSPKIKYRDDYIGMRFGSLVVISYPADNDGVRTGGAVCRCDCGNEVVTLSMSSLITGRLSMCPDCRSEAFSERNSQWWAEHSERRQPYHEHSHERLYGVWRSMLHRCDDKTVRGYGADGVKVCDEWRDYTKFRDWAFSNGYDENAEYGECTIDRINPFGDYEPSNCRWTDRFVQANNTRRNWLLNHPDYQTAN